MNGLPLLAFVLYLYLPHVTFKTAAHASIDLGRRRDASQLEEFLFAAIPSSLFLFMGWLVILTARALPWVTFPEIEPSMLGSILFAPDGYQIFGRYLGGDEVRWTVSYTVIVLCVSWILGSVYGLAALAKTVRDADPTIYTWIKVKPKKRDALSGIVFALGHMLYHPYHVSMARLGILRPFVFLKSSGDLVHGRFKGYTTSTSGEIETVTLTQVSRYTRRSLRDAIRDGDRPIRPLTGELLLKWSEVMDINEVPPTTISELIADYDNQIALAKSEKTEATKS